MSLSTPSVSGLTLSGTFNFAQVAGQILLQNLNLPVNVASCTLLNQIVGTYTPANDIYTVLNTSASVNPDFIIFICDAQANLTINNGPIIESLPIKKLFVWAGLPLNVAQFTSIQIDGRTISPLVPMAQGVPVNFELYYGTGTIS